MNKFVVLGTQRTGSSAISKLINLHPHILCGLEWTHRTPTIKKIKTAKMLLAANFELLEGFHKEYVQKKDTLNIHWVGFKILFSSSDKWIVHPKSSIALWIDQLNGHLKWLKTCEEIHIIHIVRNNHLDWLKSVFLAKTTKMFSGKNYPHGLTVHIDVNKAKSRIKAKKWVDDQISSLQLTNPYCRIEYEDFKMDNKKATSSIMNFLSCDPELMDYAQYIAVKQSKGHAKEYITNYTQLYRVLKRDNLL